MNSHEKMILTKSELAGRLGVSKMMVGRMTREGRLPVARLGDRTVRYHWPAIESQLFEQRAKYVR